MPDNLTPAQRQKCMRAVKGTRTALETVFRSAVWARGMRYRIKSKLIGKPDLVFASKKLAVFIDSCFWHNCPIHRTRPSTNIEFWSKKLANNERRDLVVTQTLTQQGWRVLRFWQHEISSNMEDCIRKIEIHLYSNA